MKHLRTIETLSGSTVVINPTDFAALINKKEFDANSTSILRVLQHNRTGIVVAYAMHSKDGTIEAEAYEVVATADQAPEASKAVAEHCGVAALL